MSDCIFCKIAAGEIPSRCIWDAEGVYAFRDINPQAPVHFLVIPREHIASGVKDVTAENSAVVAKCFEVIAKLAAQDERLKNGYRVVSNCGPDAGQTVPHLHFHVLGGEKMTDTMA
jgi:histidine triad (HIT) family protein